MSASAATSARHSRKSAASVAAMCSGTRSRTRSQNAEAFPSTSSLSPVCRSARDSCAVALTAPGKHTYTFGWVRPEAQSAADLVDMAVLYVASVNGHIDRPRCASTSRPLVITL
ncbi:MAG: DUF1636 domain-containing protein [Mesorhizobium sp.]|uniref:DUF1636 family protein n=1 Tax=Mesorhizobium sp. TaxID=1871066 RepID=UPI0011FB1E46|nr:MAG: DUF1636 domain-containing protein [Mesorhizobium sp.]